MESDQAIARAQSLAPIAENEHFQAVVAEVRQDLVNGIIAANATDFGTIAELKARLDVLELITRRITGAVNNGKVEAQKRGWLNLWNRD